MKLCAEFQSQTNVCIEILGSLHRTALALHVLGNYYITNNIPTKSPKRNLYEVVKNSPVTSGLALHIFTNKELRFDHPFLTSCRAYSEAINARKQVAKQNKVHSQLYDLLEKKSKPRIDQHRYIPEDLFVSTLIVDCSRKN